MIANDTTTIEIGRDTWERLNSRKQVGDAFDDVVKRTLDQTSDEGLNEVGFFTIDDDMGLDWIEVHLIKDGEKVPIVMDESPEPGKYVIYRQDA